jgi:hypothetical protein
MTGAQESGGACGCCAQHRVSGDPLSQDLILQTGNTFGRHQMSQQLKRFRKNEGARRGIRARERSIKQEPG